MLDAGGLAPHDPLFEQFPNGFQGLYDRQDRIEGLEVPRTVAVFAMRHQAPMSMDVLHRTAERLCASLAMVGTRRFLLDSTLHSFMRNHDRLWRTRAGAEVYAVPAGELIARSGELGIDAAFLIDGHAPNLFQCPPHVRSIRGDVDLLEGSDMETPAGFMENFRDLPRVEGLGWLSSFAGWRRFAAAYRRGVAATEALRSPLASGLIVASPLMGGVMIAGRPDRALLARIARPELLRRHSTWHIPKNAAGEAAAATPWDWDATDRMCGLLAAHVACWRRRMDVGRGAFWNAAAIAPRLAMDIVRETGIGWSRTRRAGSLADGIGGSADHMHHVPVAGKSSGADHYRVYGAGGIGYNLALAISRNRRPHTEFWATPHRAADSGEAHAPANADVEIYDPDALELHNLSRLPAPPLAVGVPKTTELVRHSEDTQRCVGGFARRVDAAYPGSRLAARAPALAVDCRDDLSPEGINRHVPVAFKLSYDGGEDVAFSTRPDTTAEMLFHVDRPAYAVDPSYHVAPAVVAELAAYMLCLSPIARIATAGDGRHAKYFERSISGMLNRERENLGV